MPKKITLIIDPETETMSVETEGFRGQGCKAVHKAFEAMGTVTKEVIKPEYYEANRNQNLVKAGR